MVISTVVGRARVVWTSATASTESYRFQLMNVTASGTARMAMGKARVIRMSILNASRPRKTNHARKSEEEEQRVERNLTGVQGLGKGGDLGGRADRGDEDEINGQDEEGR